MQSHQASASAKVKPRSERYQHGEPPGRTPSIAAGAMVGAKEEVSTTLAHTSNANTRRLCDGAE